MVVINLVESKINVCLSNGMRIFSDPPFEISDMSGSLIYFIYQPK